MIRKKEGDNFNTSYLTDSYIIFTLKMESVSKDTIFGLKMIVKSGLEKIFLKFLHAGDYFSLLHKSVQNDKIGNKNNHLPTWRDFKLNFSRPLFTVIFRRKIVFFNTDSFLRVKTMYDSVKIVLIRHLKITFNPSTLVLTFIADKMTSWTFLISVHQPELL